MVKNKKGGRNHRKQASKNSKPIVQAKIRLVKESDETYAMVVKMNGNSMCDVICSDKEVRLLQIRKKFRGRNRRDNNIGMGTMLLVGLRSWEVRKPGKKGKVDLLYVYSREQVDVLKVNPWAYNLKHIFPPISNPSKRKILVDLILQIPKRGKINWKRKKLKPKMLKLLLEPVIIKKSLILMIFNHS